MPLTVLAFGIFVFGISSDAYKDYAAHSNGNASFKMTFANPCSQGARPSGYALPLSKIVVLKQRNHDGSVGEVCSDDPDTE